MPPAYLGISGDNRGNAPAIESPSAAPAKHRGVPWRPPASPATIAAMRQLQSPQVPRLPCQTAAAPPDVSGNNRSYRVPKCRACQTPRCPLASPGIPGDNRGDAWRQVDIDKLIETSWYRQVDIDKLRKASWLRQVDTAGSGLTSWYGGRRAGGRMWNKQLEPHTVMWGIIWAPPEHATMGSHKTVATSDKPA